jgi:flagellar basal body-associated protein FliL
MNKNLKKSRKEGEFELDTVDYMKAALKKGHKKTSREKQVPDALQPPESKSKKPMNFKILSICAGVLLVIAAGFAILHSQEFSFSFLSDTPQKASNNYLSIGPISTTLSDNNIIRFSMDIGLESESSKEKLAEKTVFVKNQIISTLTKPSTAELIETRQYDLIKAKIQENLEKTTGETVSDIYFSELRIF